MCCIVLKTFYICVIKVSKAVNYKTEIRVSKSSLP